MFGRAKTYGLDRTSLGAGSSLRIETSGLQIRQIYVVRAV